MSKAQRSFRNHFSRLTNLLTTLNDWTEAVDGRDCVHACYLDISKAFDRVNHILLVDKLKNYGISGNLFSWLQDYLTDRYVQVQVDGALAERITVTSGVPQGSVLGPICYLYTTYGSDSQQNTSLRVLYENLDTCSRRWGLLPTAAWLGCSWRLVTQE